MLPGDETTAAIINYLLIAAIVVVVVLLGKNQLEKLKQSQTLNQDGQNQSSDGSVKDLNSLVRQYKNAMNPSGWNWSSDMDGTDYEAIFELAPKSRPPVFQQLTKVYKNIYGSPLLDDLQSELNSSEYAKFLQLANLS